MNRRVFLFASASTLAAQSLPSSQVSVGLIGAGARGFELLRLCLASPFVRVRAVCETFEPRMFGAVGLSRSQGHPARYYRVYTDLLADRDIDAVIVATPDFWHARMTLEAIRAGKDVYLEEPLSHTWQEALEMAGAERASNRMIQMGSQWRSGTFAEVDAVRRSRPGAVEAAARSSMLRPGVLRRGGFKLQDPLNFVDWQAAAREQVSYSPDRFLNWRFYSLYGGGIVTAMGYSMAEMIEVRSEAGPPVSVKASGVPASEEGFDTPKRASIAVEYQSLRGTIELDGTTPHAERSWKFDGNLVDLRAPEPETTRRHLANFFDAVRTRRAPNATVQKSLPAALVCHMANISIATGRQAVWDPEQSRVETRG